MQAESKLLFWNVWGHRYADGVHAFLDSHSDADVFCLTEVTDTSHRQVEKSGHNLVFTGDEAAAQVDALYQLQMRFGLSRDIIYSTADYRRWKCDKTGAVFSKVGFGSALAVRHDVTVIQSGTHRISFGHKTIKDRTLQWMVYQKGNIRFLLAHLHGVWIRGNTKGDHEFRTFQSLEVRRLLRSLALRFNISKIVFGGDLNLDISTEALNALIRGDATYDRSLRNLIAEYSVTTTRTKLYRYMGVEGHSQYADYVLTSDEVEVHSFACHTDVVASDHAALIVEIS